MKESRKSTKLNNNSIHEYQEKCKYQSNEEGITAQLENYCECKINYSGPKHFVFYTSSGAFVKSYLSG